MSPAGSYKEMPVPCFMKYFNGYCYVVNNKETCTFYSSPSYATYKACSASDNMGKTLKCSGLSEADKKNGDFAMCVDSEASAAAMLKKAGAAAKPAVFTKADGKDIKGRDVACAGKAFCEVCKPLKEVEAACAKTGGCTAFTWNGKCGYLKTKVYSGEVVSRAGWTLFQVKA
ncbi:hypothetical protein OEZ85_008913 [Tetradesmus obliquus]|uniref:Uncharacterized protein n=1 Tax=Tetradesmus obliquus TaxID=3088 RepID=A0ABY8TK76_TETOB|nr:hypothetical protein OEZ85_008913 [Tetradesmus obliquus]